MADSKISELTSYTTPLNADLVPIVDTANATTKQVSWTNIKATLKTYFDTLYALTGAITTSGLTMATGKVLGRSTAATGAIEELAVTGTGSVVLATSPTLVTPTLGVASATSLATSAATPLLLTNGQLVNIALTSQTTGATTLTIPDFASVVDEFTFKTKAQTMSNKTLTAPKFVDAGFIADANGNEQIVFQTTASAINEFEVTNAATGGTPQLAVTGGDADINLQLTPKGTGIVKGELKRFMVQLLSNTTDQTVSSTIGGDFRISNRAITVKAVGAYCDTAGTTGTFTVDINEAGVSILSTKITVDSTEKSSETAATAPVISDSAIAADAIVTFDIDAIQTTAAKGLKVWIDYVYA